MDTTKPEASANPALSSEKRSTDARIRRATKDLRLSIRKALYRFDEVANHGGPFHGGSPHDVFYAWTFLRTLEESEMAGALFDGFRAAVRS